MTDIYVYCPICNANDSLETKADSMIVVNGLITFALTCGHTVRQYYPHLKAGGMLPPDSDRGL